MNNLCAVMNVYVYIAVTLDGYIARKDGSVDYLDSFLIQKEDYGYTKFFKSIDIVILGRKTYEKVLSFDVDWPYKSKKVIVLSSTLNKNNGLPEKVKNESIEFFNGDIEALLNKISNDNNTDKNITNIYIDGGYTIRQFLSHSFIDYMILSIIPIVLGDGIPLFAQQNIKQIQFELIDSKSYNNGIVQNKYRSKL